MCNISHDFLVYNIHHYKNMDNNIVWKCQVPLRKQAKYNINYYL